MKGGRSTFKMKPDVRGARLTSMRQSLSLMKRNREAQFYEICLLPDHEPGFDQEAGHPDEISEWLAENCLDFFAELQTIYSTLAMDTTGYKWRFPNAAEYLWKQNDKAEKVSADEYIENVFLWLEHISDNPAVFPTDEAEEFPKDFRSNYMKTAFKRLFRVFAIIFSFEGLAEFDGIRKSLGVCFTHFIYFVISWKLLDVGKETKVLDSYFTRISAQYKKDLEDYKTKNRL